MQNLGNSMILTLLFLLLKSFGEIAFGWMILRPERSRREDRNWIANFQSQFNQTYSEFFSNFKDQLGVTSSASFFEKSFGLFCFLIGDLLGTAVFIMGLPDFHFGAAVFAAAGFWFPGRVLIDIVRDESKVSTHHQRIKLQFQRKAQKLRPHEAKFLGKKTSIECATCGVCHEQFSDYAAVAFCAQCQSPHHVDCWEYFEKCSVFGCSEKNCDIMYRDDVLYLEEAG